MSSVPSVFEGLLPEGVQLEALLRVHKVDKGDLLQQLLIVGADVVGSLTIREAK
jgi:serine/threonine-protein kinase HipA